MRMNASASASPSRVVMRFCQWVRRRQPAGEGVARRRALEEEWDRHLQDMANLLQPARADPVGSLLVFLDLLKGNSESIAEPRLTHVQHHTAHAHATANVLVYGIGRLFAGHRFFSQEREHRSIIETGPARATLLV